MFGLSVLLVLALYFGATLALAIRVTRPLRLTWLRTLLVLASLIAAAVGPFSDELRAEPGFRQLCQSEAKLDFDPEVMRHKKIFLEPSRDRIETLNPPITVTTYRAFDAGDNRYLGSYRKLVLGGGWLARALFGPNAAPLQVKDWICDPALEAERRMDLHVRFEVR